MIFVYGRDGCNACEQTRKLFDKLKIKYSYTYVDNLNELPGRWTDVSEFSSLPIVVVDNGAKYESWCGFKYDRIKALAVTHGGGI